MAIHVIHAILRVIFHHQDQPVRPELTFGNSFHNAAEGQVVVSHHGLERGMHLAPAVGQQCTLVGSLFNFVNNPPSPGQATATWVFGGITNTPGVTWVGNFNSQFPGIPYQTVLSDLATNGYVSNTFSATITLMVPEPGTMVFMLMGSALIGIAALLRRRCAS
jgi:hypothetical protein